MICCFSTSRSEPEPGSPPVSLVLIDIKGSPGETGPAGRPGVKGGMPLVLRATSGGNSLAVITPSFERRMARSKQFLSWRTLPGQAYARILPNASAVTSG